MAFQSVRITGRCFKARTVDMRLRLRKDKLVEVRIPADLATRAEIKHAEILDFQYDPDTKRCRVVKDRHGVPFYSVRLKSVKKKDRTAKLMAEPSILVAIIRISKQAMAAIFGDGAAEIDQPITVIGYDHEVTNGSITFKTTTKVI